MKRLFTYIFLLLLLVGCDTRRPIYDAFYTTVYYTIEWPEDVERPNGATITFYPREGSSTREPIVAMTNSLSGKVTLPRGTYDALVINETIKSHDYISFDGTDAYDTFTARWDTTQSILVRQDDVEESYDNFVLGSENVILSDKRECIIVTQEMINNYESIYINFKPTDMTYTINITAHIQGLDNAASSGSLLYLSGASEGMILSSETLLSTYVMNKAVFNNKTFDEGYLSKGTMSSSFNIFGFVSLPSANNVANEVVLSIKLRDGSTHTAMSYDIDNLIVIDEVNRTITVEINDPELILPHVEDTEKPNTDSGFDTNVEGWGEQVDVDVDLKM